MHSDLSLKISWLSVVSGTLLLVLILVIVTGWLTVPTWMVITVLLLSAFAMYLAAERRDSRPDPKNYMEELCTDLPIAAPPDDLLVRTRDIIDPTAGYTAGNCYIIEGILKLSPDDARELLKHRFEADPFTPTLCRGDGGRTILALVPRLPGRTSTIRAERGWIIATVVLATLLLAALAGSLHLGMDVLKNPVGLTAGFP